MHTNISLAVVLPNIISDDVLLTQLQKAFLFYSAQNKSLEKKDHICYLQTFKMLQR